MKLSIINPKSLADPRGYNNGVLVEGGSLLFVAGQVGWDRESRIVSDDFAGQFAQALENVLAVVREAGGEPSNVTRLLIFVTDKEEYAGAVKSIGVAYRQLMGKHYPAMTLVEVSALLEPSAKVEIEAMAVMYNTPTLILVTERTISRPNRVILSPQGTTARMIHAGTKVITGARMNISLLALAGTSSSLNISLTPSATGCSQPPGPARFGPMRT